jgi:hypothetical protein
VVEYLCQQFYKKSPEELVPILPVWSLQFNNGVI